MNEKGYMIGWEFEGLSGGLNGKLRGRKWVSSGVRLSGSCCVCNLEGEG